LKLTESSIQKIKPYHHNQHVRRILITKGFTNIPDGKTVKEALDNKVRNLNLHSAKRKISPPSVSIPAKRRKTASYIIDKGAYRDNIGDFVNSRDRYRTEVTGDRHTIFKIVSDFKLASDEVATMKKLNYFKLKKIRKHSSILDQDLLLYVLVNFAEIHEWPTDMLVDIVFPHEISFTMRNKLSIYFSTKTLKLPKNVFKKQISKLGINTQLLDEIEKQMDFLRSRTNISIDSDVFTLKKEPIVQTPSRRKEAISVGDVIHLVRLKNYKKFNNYFGEIIKPPKVGKSATNRYSVRVFNPNRAEPQKKYVALLHNVKRKYFKKISAGKKKKLG